MGRGKKSMGQALAELAMLLPALALIVVVCLDLGHVCSVWLMLSNGTGEGARVAASGCGDISSITEAVRLDVAQQGLAPGGVQVDVLGGAGDQPAVVSASCAVNLASLDLLGAQPVVIQAQSGVPTGAVVR